MFKANFDSYVNLYAQKIKVKIDSAKNHNFKMTFEKKMETLTAQITKTVEFIDCLNEVTKKCCKGAFLNDVPTTTMKHMLANFYLSLNHLVGRGLHVVEKLKKSLKGKLCL